MMMQRGVVISYETIRQWCPKFRTDLGERVAPSWPWAKELATCLLTALALLPPTQC